MFPIGPLFLIEVDLEIKLFIWVCEFSTPERFSMSNNFSLSENKGIGVKIPEDSLQYGIILIFFNMRCLKSYTLFEEVFHY